MAPGPKGDATAKSLVETTHGGKNGPANDSASPGSSEVVENGSDLKVQEETTVATQTLIAGATPGHDLLEQVVEVAQVADPSVGLQLQETCSAVTVPNGSKRIKLLSAEPSLEAAGMLQSPAVTTARMQNADNSRLHLTTAPSPVVYTSSLQLSQTPAASTTTTTSSSSTVGFTPTPLQNLSQPKTDVLLQTAKEVLQLQDDVLPVSLEQGVLTVRQPIVQQHQLTGILPDQTEQILPSQDAPSQINPGTIGLEEEEVQQMEVRSF